jgi:hypothetical protein
MSMVVTRSPLTAIGMNGAGATAPRRSARLSVEGQEELCERPGKRQKVDAAQQNGGIAKENVSAKRREC